MIKEENHLNYILLNEKKNSSIDKSNNINVYGHINIQKCLEGEDKIIKKVDPNYFLYSKHICNYKKIIDERSFNKAPNKINKITFKNIDVNFNELIFESDNHLEYNLTQIFNFEEILGEGSFGVVIKASFSKSHSLVEEFYNKIYINYNNTQLKKILKNKITFALKLIPIIDCQLVKNVKDEFNILKKIDSNRILNVYMIIENTKYIVIIMEYIKGKTLKDILLHNYIKNKTYLFHETECFSIIRGILEGIDILHNNKIIHRDIKPENIMLVNNNPNKVKLIDLGLFKKVDDYTEFCKDYCGTLLYMAPEILTPTPNYNETVDIWACGIIMYILLSGGSHPITNSINLKEKEYKKIMLSSKIEWSFNDNFNK